MSQENVVYFDTDEGAVFFDGASVKGHFWTLCRYHSSNESRRCLVGCLTGGAAAPDHPALSVASVSDPSGPPSGSAGGRGNANRPIQ